MAVAKTGADHGQTWRRLVDDFGLAGAHVGDHRTGSAGPEQLSGTLEGVHQDAKQRYVLLRLDKPGPGVVLVGAYDNGAGVNVSLCRYFYGDDAQVHAAVSEPRWRDWLKASYSNT